jgi:hypothetical protein
MAALSVALVKGVLAALLVALPARAISSELVIEIDPAAERLLDARAARRLVALELADVEVPARTAAQPALFYRVLGRARGLVRVELWERGELHDARVVSTAQGSAHLVARRVALAAAELARGLRQKRLAESRREARELTRLRAAARARAERTREGPFAVRGGSGTWRGDAVTLVGSSLTFELSVRSPVRIDLGARWLGGFDDRTPGRLTLLEASIGPARRFRLTPALDLDLAAALSPVLVHVSGATAVDAVPSVHQTWSARGAVSGRLEPRLGRAVRAFIGFESSLLLRSVLAQFPDGRERHYSGVFLGGELGLVVTP